MNLCEERSFIEELELWIETAWESARFTPPPAGRIVLSGFEEKI